MTTYTYCGREYPLVMTVAAYGHLSDLLGTSDIAELQAYIGLSKEAPLGMRVTMEHICQVLAILMVGGENHRRLQARYNGNEDAAISVPTTEELMESLIPADGPSAALPILDAVADSMIRKVEVDASKNGKSGEQK